LGDLAARNGGSQSVEISPRKSGRVSAPILVFKDKAPQELHAVNHGLTQSLVRFQFIIAALVNLYITVCLNLAGNRKEHLQSPFELWRFEIVYKLVSERVEGKN